MPEFTAPIVLKEEDRKIVNGPVLIPDEPDTDNDVVSEEQIENVAHKFVEEYGNIDLQHSLNNVGKMVESYIAPTDLDFGNDVVVPKGSWMMGVRVTDDDVWKSVKSGELTGFSIMGIEKTATKSKESVKEDDENKRTTLEDLGDNFIVNAVSLVDDPAVPKAKWVAVKSRGKKQNKEKPISQETVQKAIEGSLEERKQVVQRAVWQAFDGNETDSFVHSTNEDNVIVEVIDFMSDQHKLLQVDYEIDDNGNVSFTSDPQEVKIEESIVPVEDEGNDPMKVFSSQNTEDPKTSNKNEPSFLDKVKNMFGGNTSSEKAGRKISADSYNKLQSALEVIGDLLDEAEKERTDNSEETNTNQRGKKGGSDMDENQVKELVKSEMKPTNDKLEEVINTLKSEGSTEGESHNPANTDSNQNPSGDQQGTQKSEEGNEQNDQTNPSTKSGEGSEEVDEQAQELEEALKQIKKSKPISKRLTGQDDLDKQTEKEKPKRKRNAFGYKKKER